MEERGDSESGKEDGGAAIKTSWRDHFTIRRDLLSLKFILFFVSGGMTAFMPYLTIHMRTVGITLQEIGMIYAFIPVPCFLGPLLSGILADKLGNYKAVFLLNWILFPILSACHLLMDPVKTSSLTMSCNTAGANLNWDFCNDCHTDFNNTIQNITLMNCISKCESPPTLCFNGIENTVCDTFNTSDSNPIVTLSAKMMSVQHANVCSEIWSDLDYKGSMYQSMTCPSDCPLECLVEGMPKCTNPDSSIFWEYFLIREWAMFFMCAGLTMMEAIVLAAIKKTKGHYGKQRILAFMGNACIPLLSGFLVDYYSRGKDHTVFAPAFILGGICIGGACIVMFFLNYEVDPPSKNFMKDCKQLLKNPEIRIYLGVYLAQGILWGVLDTYLFLLLDDLGAPKILIGLTFTVGMFAGLPFLFTADNIINLIGRQSIFVIAFIFYGIRFLGYSFITNPWHALWFEALEPLSHQVMRASASTYGTVLAPQGLLATLTGLAGAVHYSIGKAVGALLGGFMTGKLGTAVTFQIMGGVSISMGVIYLILYLCYFKKFMVAEDLKKAEEKAISRAETSVRREKKDFEKEGGTADEQMPLTAAPKDTMAKNLYSDKLSGCTSEAWVQNYVDSTTTDFVNETSNTLKTTNEVEATQRDVETIRVSNATENIKEISDLPKNTNNELFIQKDSERSKKSDGTWVKNYVSTTTDFVHESSSIQNNENKDLIDSSMIESSSDNDTNFNTNESEDSNLHQKQLLDILNTDNSCLIPHIENDSIKTNSIPNEQCNPIAANSQENNETNGDSIDNHSIHLDQPILNYVNLQEKGISEAFAEEMNSSSSNLMNSENRNNVENIFTSKDPALRWSLVETIKDATSSLNNLYIESETETLDSESIKSATVSNVDINVETETLDNSGSIESQSVSYVEIDRQTETLDSSESIESPAVSNMDKDVGTETIDDNNAGVESSTVINEKIKVQTETLVNSENIEPTTVTKVGIEVQTETLDKAECIVSPSDSNVDIKSETETLESSEIIEPHTVTNVDIEGETEKVKNSNCIEPPAVSNLGIEVQIEKLDDIEIIIPPTNSNVDVKNEIKTLNTSEIIESPTVSNTDKEGLSEIIDKDERIHSSCVSNVDIKGEIDILDNIEHSAPPTGSKVNIVSETKRLLDSETIAFSTVSYKDVEIESETLNNKENVATFTVSDIDIESETETLHSNEIIVPLNISSIDKEGELKTLDDGGHISPSPVSNMVIASEKNTLNIGERIVSSTVSNMDIEAELKILDDSEAISNKGIEGEIEILLKNETIVTSKISNMNIGGKIETLDKSESIEPAFVSNMDKKDETVTLDNSEIILPPVIRIVDIENTTDLDLDKEGDTKDTVDDSAHTASTTVDKLDKEGETKAVDDSAQTVSTTVRKLDKEGETKAVDDTVQTASTIVVNIDKEGETKSVDESLHTASTLVGHVDKEAETKTVEDSAHTMSTTLSNVDNEGETKTADDSTHDASTIVGHVNEEETTKTVDDCTHSISPIVGHVDEGGSTTVAESTHTSSTTVDNVDKEAETKAVDDGTHTASTTVGDVDEEGTIKKVDDSAHTASTTVGDVDEEGTIKAVDYNVHTVSTIVGHVDEEGETNRVDESTHTASTTVGDVDEEGTIKSVDYNVHTASTIVGHVDEEGETNIVDESTHTASNTVDNLDKEAETKAADASEHTVSTTHSNVDKEDEAKTVDGSAHTASATVGNVDAEGTMQTVDGSAHTASTTDGHVDKDDETEIVDNNTHDAPTKAGNTDMEGETIAVDNSTYTASNTVGKMDKEGETKAVDNSIHDTSTIVGYVDTEGEKGLFNEKENIVLPIAPDPDVKGENIITTTDLIVEREVGIEISDESRTIVLNPTGNENKDIKNGTYIDNVDTASPTIVDVNIKGETDSLQGREKNVISTISNLNKESETESLKDNKNHEESQHSLKDDEITELYPKYERLHISEPEDEISDVKSIDDISDEEHKEYEEDNQINLNKDTGIKDNIEMIENHTFDTALSRLENVGENVSSNRHNSGNDSIHTIASKNDTPSLTNIENESFEVPHSIKETNSKQIDGSSGNLSVASNNFDDRDKTHNLVNENIESLKNEYSSIETENLQMNEVDNQIKSVATFETDNVDKISESKTQQEIEEHCRIKEALEISSEQEELVKNTKLHNTTSETQHIHKIINNDETESEKIDSNESHVAREYEGVETRSKDTSKIGESESRRLTETEIEVQKMCEEAENEIEKLFERSFSNTETDNDNIFIDASNFSNVESPSISNKSTNNVAIRANESEVEDSENKDKNGTENQANSNLSSSGRNSGQIYDWYYQQQTNETTTDASSLLSQKEDISEETVTDTKQNEDKNNDSDKLTEL